MVGNKFDVSAYCQEPLVIALDHLSSIKFAVFSLIRPALKISARSLFIENEELTFSNIISHLNSDTPIAAPPPEARQQRPKRTLFQRLGHFIFVGIPLAIFVGLIAGILNFVRSVTNDLITVITHITKLYSMCQGDIKFYKGKKQREKYYIISAIFLSLENPHLLPPRGEAINAIVNNGLTFYTWRLIDRKFGIFSFIFKPIIAFIVKLLTNRIIHFFDRIDEMRNRNRNRTIRPSAPSAPLPPPYDEKSDDFKYD